MLGFKNYLTMVINVIELYDTSHGFRTPQGLILIQ